jgi:hypothetical protein
MTDPAPETSAPAGPPPKVKHHRTRHTIGIICLVISCVLAPFAVISNFVRLQLLDTNRYVSTVAPLARNRAVTDYVATRVTDQLMDSVDVQKLAEDALPARADFLAGGIATGVRVFVEQATQRILASEQFAQIWDTANRNAHELVKKALTGQGKAVQLQNGKVVLDLSQVLIAVRTELSNRGVGIFDRLPIGDTAIRLELFDAKGLQQARTGVRALVIARVVLLVLVLLLAALGIFLAADRRRALAGWGLGIAISVGIVASVVLLARAYSLDHLSNQGIPRDAAQGVIDALLHYLRLAFRAVIALGLVIAIAATLAGPGRIAVRVREITRSAIDRSPAPDPGPFPRWVGEHRMLLRGVGLVLALLALITWSAPGATTVIVFAALLLVWLLLIEIIGRSTIEGTPPPPTSA